MYFNFLKKLENSSRYRIIQNDRNEKNKEWIIIIFYFNQQSLWNFIITLFTIVEKNIFDKENSMLVTLFSTSQPNWNFRNFLGVTINKGENFLERFASNFPRSSWLQDFHRRGGAELDKDVEIVKGGRVNGIHAKIRESAMLISWMWMRIMMALSVHFGAIKSFMVRGICIYC